MLTVSIGCLIIILMIAWSFSNLYKEGFATCNTQTTAAVNDFNIFTLECKPNQYLSQLKRIQDGATKKYSYKCCTDSSGNMQGSTGDPGEQGLQGQPGVAGEAGSPGQPGEQGPQGEPGPRGNRGKVGREQGDPGKPGEPGQTGPQGEAGADGIVESNGPVEPQIVGPKGKTGPQGPKGKMGSAGTNAPGALKQSQRKGGKTKLEKVQLYMVNALAKKRPPAPKSKLTVYVDNDDEDIIVDAATSIDDNGNIIYDDEIDIVEDFTTSCAQGQEYNRTTYKQ
jgi:hypothetical protein